MALESAFRAQNPAPNPVFDIKTANKTTQGVGAAMKWDKPYRKLRIQGITPFVVEGKSDNGRTTPFSGAIPARNPVFQIKRPIEPNKGEK